MHSASQSKFFDLQELADLNQTTKKSKTKLPPPPHTQASPGLHAWNARPQDPKFFFSFLAVGGVNKAWALPVHGSQPYDPEMYTLYLRVDDFCSFLCYLLGLIQVPSSLPALTRL